MINAFNSGATQFMADFEDASSPTFANMIEGQANMIDYTNGDLTLKTDKKSYAVGDNPATLLVRPRGWHLTEKNVFPFPMSAVTTIRKFPAFRC